MTSRYAAVLKNKKNALTLVFWHVTAEHNTIFILVKSSSQATTHTLGWVNGRGSTMAPLTPTGCWGRRTMEASFMPFTRVSLLLRAFIWRAWAAIILNCFLRKWRRIVKPANHSTCQQTRRRPAGTPATTRNSRLTAVRQFRLPPPARRPPPALPRIPVLPVRDPPLWTSLLKLISYIYTRHYWSNTIYS